MSELLQIRVHGDAALPTLIYLPGLHGDWTLVTSFRLAVRGRVRFVEFTYPRSLEWSLEAYADAVEGALLAEGIGRGWVLAESFGSQVAWPLMQPRRFQPEGLILAGGFVKHPLKRCVQVTERLGMGVSLTWLTRVLFWYARVARLRFRHAPEVLAGLQEFLVRRTELDRRAAVHRLRLIAGSDLRPIARATSVPVFHLTGVLDPVVPWPPVQRWLRRECPGWRANRVVWTADHNVLGTGTAASAEQVLRWLAAYS